MPCVVNVKLAGTSHALSRFVPPIRETHQPLRCPDGGNESRRSGCSYRRRPARIRHVLRRRRAPASWPRRRFAEVVDQPHVDVIVLTPLVVW